jgi:RNA recognition motif-containing protein
MGKKLFVGNLSFDTTDQDLRGFFTTVGKCVSATVLMDRATGRSRGFGFVEMESDDEALRAITQLNDQELQGRRISVSEARERGAPAPPRGQGFSRPYGSDSTPSRERSFGPDLPPSRPKFRKEGGSRRGLRARKRSL